MRIEAITFDVGGTLIAPWPSVGEIYSRIAADHGHKGISSDALNKQFRAVWRTKTNFNHTRDDWRALVNATFGGFIPQPPSDALFDALYITFANAKAWRVFEDVPPILEQLRRNHIKLAIVSNWDERLRPLLNQLDIAAFFDAFAISVEVGCAKPDPKIFHAALAALRVKPAAALHIGDTHGEDVLGAQKAGMSASLLNRAGATGGLKYLLDEQIKMP